MEGVLHLILVYRFEYIIYLYVWVIKHDHGFSVHIYFLILYIVGGKIVEFIKNKKWNNYLKIINKWMEY